MLNTKTNLWLSLATALLALSLAGCGGKDTVQDGAYGDSQYDGDYTSGAEGGDIDSSRLNERGLRGVDEDDRSAFLDPNNPLSTRIIYFDYDSDRVKPEFMAALEAHAQYVREHDVQLRLEGHTDERGSREYNVALGERRAESVAQVLRLNGVPATDLSLLSFGEESPAVAGSGEQAWSQNRRVELIYVR